MDEEEGKWKARDGGRERRKRGWREFKIRGREGKGKDEMEV